MTGADGSRTRTQRLIELADRVATEPEPPERRRRLPLIALLVGAVLAAGLTAGIVIALTGGDDRPAEASEATDTADTADSPPGATGAEPTRTTDAPTRTTDATIAAIPSTTAAPATTAPATTAPATSAPATTAPAAPAPTTIAMSSASFGDPVRWAEFSGGIVYLRGTVPDQATADEIRAKAAAVVGEGNVVVEYDIVPGAPRPESAPLYVRDSVLFAKNSVGIDDTARGVLDLGVVLMAQNPQITIDVQGHTDSDGSDATNLALSQRRVDVIDAYLVAQGVDPARLTTASFGETQPIADNATAEGRSQNRRVEFTINDLLG